MFTKKSLRSPLVLTAIILSIIIAVTSLVSMAVLNRDSEWYEYDNPNYVGDDAGKCPYGEGKCACEEALDDDILDYEYPDYDSDYVLHDRWFTPLTTPDGWFGEGFYTEWGVSFDKGTTASHNFGENGLKVWINENSFNYYPALFHAICCKDFVYIDWDLPVNFHIDTTQASDHITAWAEAVFNVESDGRQYTKVNFDQVMAYVTENGLDERMSPLRPNQGYYKGSITLRDALNFIINESVGDERPEVRNRKDAGAIYQAFLENDGVLRLIQTRVYVFAPDFTNHPDFDTAEHFDVWPTYFHENNFALIHEFSFGRAQTPANSAPLFWCWRC